MQMQYSWLAIRGPSRDNAFAQLKLEPTPEVTDVRQTEFSSAELDGDVLLVCSRRFDFADQAPLAELSSGGDVTTCCVNEEFMYSSVSYWKSGQSQWYFFHDGSFGIQHMHSEGNLPPEFHEIANRLMVAQAEGEGIAITVDHVFEVAPQVAAALTGFHVDAAMQSDITFRKATPASDC